MEVRAVAKYVRVQPRKVRQIAREVRGKSAVQISNVLQFHPGKGAFVLRKVIQSAIANAAENHGLDADTLKVREIQIDEGPKLKRISQRAMGRANRIFKRMSHITVVVEDGEMDVVVKPHGTKAKPRPKFDVPKGKKKGVAPAEAAKVEEAIAEPTTENITTPAAEPIVHAEETAAQAIAATPEEAKETD